MRLIEWLQKSSVIEWVEGEVVFCFVFVVRCCDDSSKIRTDHNSLRVSSDQTLYCVIG